MLDELSKLTKVRIGEKPIEFITKFDESLPRVLYGDQTRVKQVILNILTNAAKYTDKGKIVFSYEDNTLKISDTGIGINEKDLPRIFEKGYTGFNGRLNQKSSGLGLYLVKRSCDMLDHQIKIESKLNIGTDVYLSFNENKTKLD